MGRNRWLSSNEFYIYWVLIVTFTILTHPTPTHTHFIKHFKRHFFFIAEVMVNLAGPMAFLIAFIIASFLRPYFSGWISFLNIKITNDTSLLISQPLLTLTCILMLFKCQLFLAKCVLCCNLYILAKLIWNLPVMNYSWWLKTKLQALGLLY